MYSIQGYIRYLSVCAPWVVGLDCRGGRAREGAVELVTVELVTTEKAVVSSSASHRDPSGRGGGWRWWVETCPFKCAATGGTSCSLWRETPEPGVKGKERDVGKENCRKASPWKVVETAHAHPGFSFTHLRISPPGYGHTQSPKC